MTGRFLSVDPLGFASGATNLNQYIENNPVLYADSTGLSIASGVVSALLGTQD